jgi:hypothetical protein
MERGNNRTMPAVDSRVLVKSVSCLLQCLAHLQVRLSGRWMHRLKVSLMLERASIGSDGGAASYPSRLAVSR